MGVLSNITNRIANAFQPSTNGRVVDNFFSRDPFKLLELDKNFNGKYDNYYPNANRIVQVASQYPIYLVDEDNGVSESPFAEVLKNPNQSFPRRKVYEQIYTELITHGESNIFIWHKQGKDESSHYEPGKAKLAPEKFTGITLVSGYDTSKLTPQDKKDIVKITYGVNQRNVFLGYSPTQAANAWRKMQDAMGSHSTSFAANSGISYVFNKAVDIYNVDFVIFDSIAMEVFGGGWHASPRHRRLFASKREYLLNAGYSIVIIWLDKRRFNGARVAEYLISISKVLSSNPSSVGKEYVILGNGNTTSRRA